MWSTGIARETCSCGAEFAVPATPEGYEQLRKWRNEHKHGAVKSLRRPFPERVRSSK